MVYVTMLSMSHYAASIGNVILKQCILLEGVRTGTVLA